MKNNLGKTILFLLAFVLLQAEDFSYNFKVDKTDPYVKEAVILTFDIQQTNEDIVLLFNFDLKKNDKIVQSGNTSLMLWKIDELIAYVSTFFMLKKGDILFTGTPAGVGKVAVNDYLSGSLENKELFNVRIK